LIESYIPRFLTPSNRGKIIFIFALFFGPAAGTPAWEIVHATGQKIIVAASILTGLMLVLLG